MDIESLGGGAGAGLIGTILTVFGFGRRVNKLEDNKQEKSVCDAIHKGTDGKIDVLLEGQKLIFVKIDAINEYLRNQR